MKIIENSKVKEKLYIEKLENGLTIMVIPKKNIQKKYVMWSTNYGSIDNEFVIPDEEQNTKVPDGVAHFLEHKMFEQENGTNSLDTLTALGVNANAYTTTDHTAYLFESTDNFYEALDELLNYVQNPYFTDENVEKEKGIIGQEIMMYDDYPEWTVYMNAIKNMYYNHPITIDIAGSIDSISKINKNILYKCYNTFYNPANVVMCFVGDFKPEGIIEYTKERINKNKIVKKEIKRIIPEEPNKIVKKETNVKMEVSMPLFVIGIKCLEEIKANIQNIIKQHIAIEIILNILAGKSSNLYKQLYEAGKIQSEMYLEYEFSKTYSHIAITGQSNNPKEIFEKIKSEINTLKQQGIDENHFIRVKNMIYGTYIKEYNSVSDIARMFISDYFKGINSFDYLEKFEEVDINYTVEVLEKVFKEEKMVISIVEPKC